MCSMKQNYPFSSKVWYGNYHTTIPHFTQKYGMVTPPKGGSTYLTILFGLCKLQVYQVFRKLFSERRNAAKNRTHKKQEACRK